jgi:hypothetical protein
MNKDLTDFIAKSIRKKMTLDFLRNLINKQIRSIHSGDTITVQIPITFEYSEKEYAKWDDDRT